MSSSKWLCCSLLEQSESGHFLQITPFNILQPGSPAVISSLVCYVPQVRVAKPYISCPIPECSGYLEEGMVISHLANDDVAKYRYFLELSQLDSSTKPCPQCSQFTSLKEHHPTRSEHKYKVRRKTWLQNISSHLLKYLHIHLILTIFCLVSRSSVAIASLCGALNATLRGTMGSNVATTGKATSCYEAGLVS